ncbi:MAG: DUF5681 domain-containing protein [Candidatus Binatia bacterium]
MSKPHDWDLNNYLTSGKDSVGYRKPPVANRFRPGQSGNPRGRRKGVKNVATIFSDALYKPVKIRTAGRVRSLPKIEAIIEVILNKGLSGDTAAISKIIELAHKLGGFQFLAASASSSSNDESVLEELRRLITAGPSDAAQSDATRSTDSTPEPNPDQKKTKE